MNLHTPANTDGKALTGSAPEKRTTYEIAVTALDDLYAVQDGFDSMRSIFIVMLSAFPEGDTANALAKLGMLELESWSDKVSQWADCMDSELDAFPAEQLAYAEKNHLLISISTGTDQ